MMNQCLKAFSGRWTRTKMRTVQTGPLVAFFQLRMSLGCIGKRLCSSTTAGPLHLEKIEHLDAYFVQRLQWFDAPSSIAAARIFAFVAGHICGSWLMEGFSMLVKS